MPKYVLAYCGGSRPVTGEQRSKVTRAWSKWFADLGRAVVDPGAPFGASSAEVAPNGQVRQAGGSGLSGYSILTADSLAAATEFAQGCPVLAAGGTVEVYETYVAPKPDRS